MQATADAPHLPPMDIESADDHAERGRQIGRRFDALDISDREWHKRTNIDRKTLQRAIEGRPTVRTSTYDAIESNLDKLEAKLRGRPTVTPDKDPSSSGLIRFEVKGAYGFDAIVVEGPVENVDELVASVEKIMRNMQRREDNSQDS